MTLITRWRHQMETFFALLAICTRNSPVTGKFPPQRPVTRSFDVFFDLRLIKYLSKKSRCRGFGTQSRSLWRHCNERAHTCKTMMSLRSTRQNEDKHCLMSAHCWTFLSCISPSLSGCRPWISSEIYAKVDQEIDRYTYRSMLATSAEGERENGLIGPLLLTRINWSFSIDK